MLGLEVNECVSKMAMPLVILTRLYSKLPFAYCLVLHQWQVRDLSRQETFPDFSKMNFKTYKDKVLYTLRKIISEYYQYNDLCNAIQDLETAARRQVPELVHLHH